MANAIASHVTEIASWRPRLDRKNMVTKVVRITGGTYGGTTNLIPASVLGFRQLLEGSNGILDDNSKIIACYPSYGGVNLLTCDLTIATDASRIPADLTLTTRVLEVTVTGLE
jgi:hypothetical protein